MLMRHGSASAQPHGGRGVSAKSESRAALRRAQKSYLDYVLARDPKHRTLSAIAREGGINHTTLTRFMNAAGHDAPLDSLTIQRVAEVTGIRPPPELGLIAPLQLAEEGERYHSGDGDLALDHAVQALIGGRNSAFASWLRTDALEGAGFHSGDLVIVDQNTTPRANDAVCATVISRSRSEAETIYRVYVPPFLVAANTDPAMRKPLTVDGEYVVIMGVVTERLWRRSAA